MAKICLRRDRHFPRLMADDIISPEGIMFGQYVRKNSFARVLVVAIFTLALSACGSAVNSASSSHPSATARPSASPNPADVQALLHVADQAIPFYAELDGCPGCPKYKVYAGCEHFGGQWSYAHCPDTPRLQAYFQQHSYSLCRTCTQGSPARSMTAEVTPTGGVVHVVLYDGLLKLDLIMVKVNGQYLVDDSTCTGGGPDTSIYNPPPDLGPTSAWTCGFAG
jgi:hypothetical protein